MERGGALSVIFDMIKNQEHYKLLSANTVELNNAHLQECVSGRVNLVVDLLINLPEGS